MTQEEKELLLKDLCVRLPYYTELYSNAADDNWAILTPVVISNLINADKDLVIKPYLRPMSSMTKEELNLLKEAQLKDTRLYAESLTKAAAGDTSMRGKVITHFAADWCDKNHFDYRGLIPMGLALEAPDGMYKNE